MESSYYDEKGNYVYQKVTDFAPVINANDDKQRDGSNGYTLDRTIRHIGAIPAEAFHRWAKQANYYEMDKVQRNIAIRNYLTIHPEYRTVESIVTHNVNDGNIVIR